MIKNGEIFIIDFGLATFFSQDGKTHHENTMTDSLIGTPKYTSLHIHMGNTYSRRDDMVAIGYMMMSLEYIDVPLPWSDCQSGLLLDDYPSAAGRPGGGTGYMLESCVDKDYPDIHILHPLNIYRQFLKSIENIQHWLKTRTNEDGDSINRWMDYLCATYAMTYPEKPKYDQFAEIFSDMIDTNTL